MIFMVARCTMIGGNWPPLSASLRTCALSAPERRGESPQASESIRAMPLLARLLPGPVAFCEGPGSFKVSWLFCTDMAFALPGVLNAFVATEVAVAPVAVEARRGARPRATASPAAASPRLAPVASIALISGRTIPGPGQAHRQYGEAHQLTLVPLVCPPIAKVRHRQRPRTRTSLKLWYKYLPWGYSQEGC